MSGARPLRWMYSCSRIMRWRASNLSSSAIWWYPHTTLLAARCMINPAQKRYGVDNRRERKRSCDQSHNDHGRHCSSCAFAALLPCLCVFGLGEGASLNKVSPASWIFLRSPPSSCLVLLFRFRPSGSSSGSVLGFGMGFSPLLCVSENGFGGA